MKGRSRIWVWVVAALVVGVLVVPVILDWWSDHQREKRISQEKQKIAELVQAGDRGYDSLVKLVPTLWFGNVSPALNGILAQKKRDRVADLCAIYPACGSNTREEIAKILGNLGDPRGSVVLIKDLESVWQDLHLITCDNQIEALGLMKATNAGDILLKILRHHYSWEGSAWSIKEKTFVALGEIGDERALPDASQYIAATDNFYDDWYIEQGAMNYLTRIGSSEAKAILVVKYQKVHRPELALCLVQLGETSVLPDIRLQLRAWLDDFAVHGWGGNWDFFYCVHALLLANDNEALPELRRALAILKNDDAKTKEYIRDDAAGYSVKLLLNESQAETLVPDLEGFLNKQLGVSYSSDRF